MAHILNRYPPYARKVLKAIQSGEIKDYAGTSPNGIAPQLHLVIGDQSWLWVKSSPRYLAVVCPPYENPLDMDWTCLAGHDPVLLVTAGQHEGDQLRRLLSAVVRDGVDRIIDLANGNRYVAGGGE